MQMPWIKIYEGYYYPDFEGMVRAGIDAIWLTAHGESATRFSRPYSLYGWDCESVLIMNPSGIVPDLINQEQENTDEIPMPKLQ